MRGCSSVRSPVGLSVDRSHTGRIPKKYDLQAEFVLKINQNVSFLKDNSDINSQADRQNAFDVRTESDLLESLLGIVHTVLYLIRAPP